MSANQEDSESRPIPSEKIVLEYIWLGGNNEFRSKIRVINRLITNIKDIPIWNYDGSSTGQATGNNSEVTLFPCAAYKNPLTQGFLVLCSFLVYVCIRNKLYDQYI